MSTQIVEVPGVGEVEFPADMPDDKIAAEIAKLTAPPQQTPNPEMPRVRDALRRPTLAEREGVPTHLHERFNRYTDEARAARAGQGAFTRYADTAVRGLARAVPFMDDIAATGDAAIGRGEGADFMARREDQLLRQRALNAVDDEERGALSYGSQFAGAVALPGGAIARGATLGSKVKRGAAIGAGYGAASGFGAGYDATDRFSRAAYGAGIGGGLGALIPGLGAGAAKTKGALSTVANATVVPAAQSVRRTIAGYRDPEAEALRRVRAAIDADVRANSERLIPSRDWMQAYETGQTPRVGDFGGETTRALARSAANTSNEGRDALVNATSGRFREQGQRTADFVGDLARLRADPVTAAEAIRNAARGANRPLYDRAYAEGDALWGGTLEELTRSPAVQKVMRTAEQRANDRTAAFTDAPVVRNPFVLDEQTGQMVLRAGPDGSYALPNLAYWDLVKRGLDDAVGAARRAGEDDEVRTLTALTQRLRNELDERVPSYAEARGVAARFFGVEDALEAGQAFARNRNPTAGRAAEFTQMLGQMPQHERDMFAQGYAMELVQAAMNARDTTNVVTKLFANPEARRQIGMVLGPQRAQQLEGYVLRENIMDRLRVAVQGNSTTAKQLQEMGLAGGVGMGAGYLTGGDMGSASMGAIVAAAMKRGATHVDANVSREVARILASDSPEMIERALINLDRSPAGRNTLRQISAGMQRLLPRPAAPAAGTVAAPKPTAPAAGATETLTLPKAVGNEVGSQQGSRQQAPAGPVDAAVPAAAVVAPRVTENEEQ